MAQAASSRKPRPATGSRFYIAMGVVALFAAFTGFATTFFLPVAAGTFRAPLVVYLHGACAFAWVIIFAIQPWLIRHRNFRQHKQLGFAGLGAAIGFAVTAMPVAAFAVTRDVAAGGGDAAVSSMVGTFTSAQIFLGLVIGGVVTRRKSGTHKRLMLLATIAVLWPAWFRFRHYFPDIPNPEIVFAIVVADSLIIVAALRDLIVERRVHAVWLIGGTLLIAEHITEAILFDTPVWRVFAQALYAPFAP